MTNFRDRPFLLRNSKGSGCSDQARIDIGHMATIQQARQALEPDKDER